MGSGIVHSRFVLLAAVAVACTRADNVYFPDWKPPKCASWCHWEPVKNCKLDQCVDCDTCRVQQAAAAPAVAKEEPSDPKCAGWCDSTQCGDSRCTACASCTSPAASMWDQWQTQTDPAASKPIEEPQAPVEPAKCMSFCVAHHCSTHDERCAGCSICGGKLTPGEPAAQGGTCAAWCKPTTRGHCGVDERCDGCSFCDGKTAGQKASIDSNAVTASGATPMDTVGGESCKDIGLRLEVHQPTRRFSLVPSNWLDGAAVTVDFRGTAIVLEMLEDGAHNHNWEEVPPVGVAPGEAGVQEFRLKPRGAHAGDSRLEKLSLTILSDENLPWEDPSISCRMAWVPYPPSPPSPSAPPASKKAAAPYNRQPPPPLPSKPKPPKQPDPTVLSVTCTSATISWEAGFSTATSGTALEFEMTVMDVSTRATLSTITTSGTRYRVEHLTSATAFEFKVRARDLRHAGAGWSAYGSVKASLHTPSESMAAPQPPLIDASAATSCSSMQLLLPPLRKDCEAETSLVLQYRTAGGGEWAAYLQQGLTSQRLVVKVSDPATAYEFRLIARRGELSSPPSSALGPVAACSSAANTGQNLALSVHSQSAVVIAAALVFLLCGLSCCYLFWAMTRGRRREKRGQMVRTVDQESSIGMGAEEVTVHYHISGAVQSGVLPLEGVTSIEDLLEEIAEFGMELIEGADIEAQDLDVHYEDQGGKLKKLGQRTPLSTVCASESLTVTEKSEGKSFLTRASKKKKRRGGE